MKTAGRNTINDLAFIARRKVTRQANADMDISGNAKRALGFRVKKATYGRMVAEIYTTRGWLYYHLNKGKREAKSGFVWKGENWLILPLVDKAFTRRGRLKKAIAQRVIVIPRRTRPLLLHRTKRGKGLGIVAVLAKRVKYKQDTNPQRAINQVMRRYGHLMLLKQLQKYGTR